MKSLLRDNFCSSPWFHIRIDPAGNYLPCRWGDQWEALTNSTQCNINNTKLSEYMNSDQILQLRLAQDLFLQLVQQLYVSEGL